MNTTLNTNPYRILIAMLATFTLCFWLCSCDGHNEVIDTGQVGYILCTDGHVRTYNDVVKNKKEPIAVVFYGNSNLGESGGNTFAVYLYDVPALQFCDSLGVSQGTSTDLSALDGKENTYAIMSKKEVHSPLANAVFSMWAYGQSAYVPSVAQYKLLYANKAMVNKVIKQCGGDPLPDTADDCWYWSSTEVSGAQTGQAWLFSMESGTIQETPKTVNAKLRPIVTIY